MSDLDNPKPDDRLTETVNAKSFWDDITKSIILSGVNKELSRESRLFPNYAYWSPWIGEHSRNGDNLYNTEFRKCSPSIEEDINDPMPEELLIHLLLDEKVSTFFLIFEK